VPDRISVDFDSLSSSNLWNRGGAVVLALDGNPRFPNPPVSMEDLKALVDAYSGSLVTLLGDKGTKRAMATRDSRRAELIRNLKLVAAYVQANCGGDASGTGFETVSKTRKPPKPVSTPSIRKIGRGPISGTIILYIAAMLYASSYEVRYAAMNGGIPGPWTSVAVTNVKSATTISGLTPITQYAFQVRAIGCGSTSDWSNSVLIVCV
jgi:Fibronectin type III domain